MRILRALVVVLAFAGASPRFSEAQLATTLPAPATRPAAAPAPPLSPAPQADALSFRAAEAYRRGAFANAAELWKQAERAYASAGRTDGRCDVLCNLSGALQALGQYREAGDALVGAAAIAESLRDAERTVAALSGLGTLYTFTGQPEEADRTLQRALELARGQNDLRGQAFLLSNLGNLRAYQRRDEDAQQAYDQAIAAANQAGDGTTAAQARANAALAAAGAGAGDKAAGLNRLALTEAANLGADHEQAMLLLTIGQTFELIKPELRREAYGAYAKAQETAERVGDRAAASHALGSIGHLYETDGRGDEALQLTRRAAFLAQSVQSPHALYRWQWQTGRLLAAKGDAEAAIRSYSDAVTTLQPIQNDLIGGRGNQGPRATFRESVAPLFYELADLLLRRADGTRDERDAQRSLLEARQAVELLKAGELQDYFKDPCVSLLRSRAKSVEAIDRRTAVVYLIPLADRTELLVSLGSGLHRVKVPVTSAALVEQVREFRVGLEDRTTNRYQRNARQLYDWLIRPIDSLLQSSGVDTLVFVPDGALRTIPMAALNDGKDFLISRYAVAVTPGLTLMDPKAIARTGVNVLRAGLSVPVKIEDLPEFPALEYVPAELESLHRLFGGVGLLNEQFVRRNLERELKESEFTVVHIASHGEFSGDPRSTYLVMYDKRLPLRDLSLLIEPSRFRERPLELLTLSACQTAAGDDRAALGLAGVAIAAGARSAVATLWSVNDEASQHLITAFYAELQQDPTLSKAKAMQRAQLKLMSDLRYRHAFFWSPYLVIGNWL